MNEERNGRSAQIEIRDYLEALARSEPGDDWESRGVVYRRAMELYWTVSRSLLHARERLFPDYGRRPARAARPDWRPAASPGLVSGAWLKSPRLLLDMTSTLRSGKNTGIQRVVREIARHGWAMSEAVPVAIHGGELFTYYRAPGQGERVEIEDGDIFLLLDAAWNHLDEYLPFIEEVRARGGSFFVGVHDILPIIYPAAFPPDFVCCFEGWLEKVVLRSDGAIANSRATAESLCDFLAARAPAMRGFPIGWWRLGNDFSHAGGSMVSPVVERLAGGRPYFLGVGTVEPRKGYPLVLDALEKLWAGGVDAAYVIVGGAGWGMSRFEQRMKSHCEFNKRLFWLSNASDADLTLLYRNARALVLASVAEGFGLPIVEAGHYGAPVIATDIPVFREAAGDGAQYFRLLDSDDLAARMREALIERRRAPALSPMNWRDSAAQLFGMVRSRDFQMRLGEGDLQSAGGVAFRRAPGGSR